MQKKSPQTQDSKEEIILQLFSQTLQQQRIIYQLIKTLGGSVVLDENAVTPLWAIGTKRLPDGKIQIMSKELDTLNEDQLVAVVTSLRGTSKMITEGMADAGISEYPSHYVQQAISMAITWNGEKWIDTKDVKPSFRPPADPSSN